MKAEQPFYQKKFLVICAFLVVAVMAIVGVWCICSTNSDTKQKSKGNSLKSKECLTEQDKFAKWYFGEALPYSCDFSSMKAPKARDFKDEDWLHLMKVFHEDVLKRPSCEFILEEVKDYEQMKNLILSADSSLTKTKRVQVFYLEALCRLKQQDLALKLFKFFEGKNQLNMAASSPLLFFNLISDNISPIEASYTLEDIIKNPCFLDEEIVPLVVKFKDIPYFPSLMGAAVRATRPDLFKQMVTVRKSYWPKLRKNMDLEMLSDALFMRGYYKNHSPLDDIQIELLRYLFNTAAATIPADLKEFCQETVGKTVNDARFMKLCTEFAK